MIGSDFLKKIQNITITRAENGLYYLDPLWKQEILSAGLTLPKNHNWDEIKDILKLEVEKRNTVNSNVPFIVNWLHEVLTTQVEPAVLQEESDYIKNLSEYLKANHEAHPLT